MPTTRSSPPDTPPAPAGARPISPVAVALLLCGVGLRVLAYARDRSLWLDEAMLALNIVGRGFGDLMTPLSHHQEAPIGYLWSVKLLTLAFGEGEYALRSLSLLAALLALPVFYRISRRLLSENGSLIAVALFVFCVPLARFAAELKPYSLDVLVGLVLIDATLAFASRSADRAGLGRLLLVGGLAPWFSYPSLFVLAGCGAWLWTGAGKDGRRVLFGVGGVWLASFAALFALVLRHRMSDAVLGAYWSSSFAPFPPLSVADLRWYPRTLFAVLRDVAGIEPHGVGVVALAFGLLAAWRTDRRWLVMLGATVSAAFAASALSVYPFSGRILLWCVPLLLLALAAGAAFVMNHEGPALRGAGGLLTGILMLYPMGNSVLLAARGPGSQQTRPLLEQMKQDWREGDQLFLYFGAIPAYSYYAPRLGLEAIEPRVGFGASGDLLWSQGGGLERWANFERDVDGLAGAGRVWLLFSHIWRGEGVDDETLHRFLLDRRGSRLAELRTQEAALYLYDFPSPRPFAAPPE